MNGVSVGLAGSAVVLFGSWLLGSWLPVVVGSLASVSVALVRRDRMVERRERQRMVAVRTALARIDAAVRGGQALGPAVQGAFLAEASDHPHIAEVGARLRGGMPLAHALTVPAGDEAIEDSTELVLVTLAVLADRGGPAAEALSRLLDVFHGLDAATAEADAAAAQVRASAVVLVSLPVVFAGVGALVDTEIRSVFIDRPVGAACVAVAGLLDVVAWRWMRQLVSG